MSNPSESELSGRVALVTGANTGIGKVTARELAARGMHVFITCRTEEKGRPVVQEIIEATGNSAVECLAMELGDFDSIRACAAAFLERELPLHLLINNAGLGVQKGMTESGFELAFGVNFLGPFLLTNLLLDRVVSSAPARIVNVASVGHYNAKSIDLEAVQQSTPSQYGSNEYYVSKLANVLFNAELGRRLQGTEVHTYSLHPGIVASDVWRGLPVPAFLTNIAKRFMKSVEDGAKTTLYCATSPDVAKETGLYYDSCAVKEASELARDETLARELWKKSEAWVR